MVERKLVGCVDAELVLEELQDDLRVIQVVNGACDMRVRRVLAGDGQRRTRVRDRAAFAKIR